MKNIQKTIIAIFLVFVVSCSNKKNYSVSNFSDGSIQSLAIQINKNLREEIQFYENGNIKSISKFKNGLKEGEQLNFYGENGLLKSKIYFSNNKANGVAYWFYESGALKASGNYQNDKEWNMGFEYWDYDFVINKSLVRFDDKGKVYYKLNFDSTGRPTQSEGDTLHSGVIPY